MLHLRTILANLVTISPISVLSLALCSQAAAATLSVGPGKTYAAPCAAIYAAKDGDTIEIQGGRTYSGDVCTVSHNNLTIRGVNGRPKINAATRYAAGKGTWVVTGNDTTVENVEMYGAKVPDANGAAIRLEGTNFTLRNSFFHDNENGILTNANTKSDILIEYSEFGHNGHGDGQSHNLYISHVNSLTFRYSYSHDANVGHNLKSRANTNTIIYSRFSSNAPGKTGSTATGQPSYEINLPNAGTAYIIGNVIQQPAANRNAAMVAYGEEGATNPTQDLYVINNTFLNDDADSGTFLFISAKVTGAALVQNNIFAGTGVITGNVNAVLKNNYAAAAPGFVNRAAYDLRPIVSALVVDAAADPGVSAAGVSLMPVAQYRGVASGESRPVSGTLDIGAYEAVAGSTTIPAAPDAPTAPAPSTPEPSTPTAPVTDGAWTPCAAEGGICAFSGTHQVRYGANGNYATATATGTIACSNSVFGDVAPGFVKTCSVSTSASSAVVWTACANEGNVCKFGGQREVRYGTASKFVTKTFTGRVTCSNAMFGDPAPGFMKKCSVSSAVK
jgi:hypothetical protein